MHPIKRLTLFFRNNRRAASTISAVVGGALWFFGRIFLDSRFWHGSDTGAVSWLLVILGLGAGLMMFTYGFSVWREKRMIENIPTSKVRSLAMGLVEVCGQAQPKALLTSPITSTRCVYYKYLVERRERRGKSDRWVVVSQGASTNYFYVDDGTGWILVDPVEADIKLNQDYRYADAMSAEDIMGSFVRFGGFGERMRYTEWYIVPGDQVYVMGAVTRWKNDVQDRQFALADKLRELKADKERMREFDRNGDGVVDAEEWEAARERVEQDILRQELDNPRDASDDYVIARDPSNHTMIVSDQSEKQLVRGKAVTAWLLLIFGAALLIGAVCFMAAKL